MESLDVDEQLEYKLDIQASCEVGCGRQALVLLDAAHHYKSQHLAPRSSTSLVSLKIMRMPQLPLYVSRVKLALARLRNAGTPAPPTLALSMVMKAVEDVEELKLTIENFEALEVSEQTLPRLLCDLQRKVATMEEKEVDKTDHKAALGRNARGGKGGGGSNKKGPCTHCGKDNHDVSTCWELHPGLKKKRPPSPRKKDATAPLPRYSPNNNSSRRPPLPLSLKKQEKKLAALQKQQAAAAVAAAAASGTGSGASGSAQKVTYPNCSHCGRTNHPLEQCFFAPEAKAQRAAAAAMRQQAAAAAGFGFPTNIPVVRGCVPPQLLAGMGYPAVTGPRGAAATPTATGGSSGSGMAQVPNPPTGLTSTEEAQGWLALLRARKLAGGGGCMVRRTGVLPSTPSPSENQEKDDDELPELEDQQSNWDDEQPPELPDEQQQPPQEDRQSETSTTTGSVSDIEGLRTFAVTEAWCRSYRKEIRGGPRWHEVRYRTTYDVDARKFLEKKAPVEDVNRRRSRVRCRPARKLQTTLYYEPEGPPAPVFGSQAATPASAVPAATQPPARPGQRALASWALDAVSSNVMANEWNEDIHEHPGAAEGIALTTVAGEIPAVPQLPVV